MLKSEEWWKARRFQSRGEWGTGIPIPNSQMCWAQSSAPTHLGGAPTPAPSGRPSSPCSAPARHPRLLPHTHFMPRLKSFIRGHSSENVKENVNPANNGQEPFVCDKIGAVTCALLALRVRRETLTQRTTSETPPLFYLHYLNKHCSCLCRNC